MIYCSFCNCSSDHISVYPCGHAYSPCCVSKFLEISLCCPVCHEPNSICFSIERIKVVDFITS